MPPKAAPSSPVHAPFFFTDPALIGDGSLELRGPDVRHLGVRRAKEGDHILVGDGAGTIYEAQIDSITSAAVRAVISSAEQLPAHRPTITVVQGLAKGSKVDWAVEKMVELGVDRVVVFASGRSVPVWDEAKGRAAAKRWERVAHAAAKQSHRAWLPVIEGPLSAEEAVDLVEHADCSLVGDPNAKVSLREALSDDRSEEILLVVGPEGGLDLAETEHFCNAGAISVGMGSQILRTETAGIALACLVMFQVGRLG